MIKNLFQTTHFVWLIIIYLTYFGGTYYIENIADDNYLEMFETVDPKKFSETIELLVQAVIALSFAISVFYAGKMHDSTRTYVEKLSEFRYFYHKFHNSDKINSKKESKKILEKLETYDHLVKYHFNGSGMILTMCLLGSGMFLLILYQILNFNSEINPLQIANLVISLISSTMFFLFIWSFSDHLVTKRNGFFTELVDDIARLKADLT